ncbi:MAG: PAS domain S-box protein, partial [Candidatus Lokiarchaeota archaeon]|nr:PAS domain S-box protein [Candidatus Lokiarchaeota archaeon]
ITKVLLRTIKSQSFIPEIRLKNDNNQFIWYEIKARRIKDYNRQRKILITLKNISKFKALEEKLQKREEKYQKITNSIPEIQFWKVLTPSKYKGAIHTTSEMLQIIINNIPQCIFWKDLNFKYLGCNHNFVKFLDLESPEDIIGKRDENLFVTKEKIKMINDKERKVILTGESEYHFHEFWVKNNGEEICLEINRVPLIDSDEDIIGVLCTFEEITDRNITEEKLQKSEEKYKKLSSELETIIELIPGMIFVKDKDDVITRVNQSFADAFELNKEEMLGKTTFDLFPKNKATVLRNDDLDILNSGKPKFNIEETVDFPSGKISTITTKVPYYNENEEIDGITGLAVDITERKINEQKLRESEDKYKNLFEQCPLAMLLINFDGTIEDCNTPLETLFGYNKQEILGQHFLKINVFHSDSIPLLIKGFKEFLKTGVPERSEIRAYKKDGKIVWISSHPIAIKIAGISYILVMIQDITSRKKAEQKLKESEEKFRTIAEQSFMGIIIIQDGLFKYFNEQARKLNEYSLEEIQSWEPYEFAKLIHPDDKEFVMEQARKKQEGEKYVIQQHKYRIITK